MPIYIPFKKLKKGVIKIMVPEQLSFLNEFDSFYEMLIEQAKQDKISEADFYMIIKAKCKAQERELRERIKVEWTD